MIHTRENLVPQWLRRRSGWTSELALLTGLLAATTLFGRPFSKLGVPALNVYVTELAVMGLGLLLVAHHGVSAILGRVRRAVPLPALVIFWIAGLVASLRGVFGFGVEQILPDIGLFEYSLFLPLVAAVVDTPARAVLMMRVLVYASLGAAGLFATLYFAAPQSALRLENPGSAIAVYMAVFLLVLVARLAWGEPVRTWEIFVASAVLVLMALLVTRSVSLAVVCSLLTIALVLRGKQRLLGLAIVAGAVCVGVGGALAVHELNIGRDPPPIAVPVAPTAGPDFEADDRGGGYYGGLIIDGDGDRSRLSRELKIGELFELPALRGLEPGRVYTIKFSIKPLERKITTGVVGDTSGRGWGLERWTTAPSRRWQRFQKTLRASRETERLVVFPLGGAARLRVDRMKVLKGRMPGTPGDFEVQAPLARPGFVADDAGTAFTGGEAVAGDADQGRFSRELQRGELFDLPALRGLRRGRAYAVDFGVKPLQPKTTSGLVGDLSGRGWGSQAWKAAPAIRWQSFSRTFTATASAERLTLYPEKGAARVRLDGVRVRPLTGTANALAKGTSSAQSLPGARPRPPLGAPIRRPDVRVVGRATIERDEDDAPLISNFKKGLGTEPRGESGNMYWRLGIWRFALRKGLRNPVLGVGFGEPTAYRLGPYLYDARRGVAADPNDITAPHNSFVNILFRTGLLGALPLAFLMALGFGRAFKLIRSSAAPQEARVFMSALASLFVFITVIAFFNVALEGPYMAIFFWTILALLIALPKLEREGPEEWRLNSEPPANRGLKLEGFGIVRSGGR